MLYVGHCDVRGDSHIASCTPRFADRVSRYIFLPDSPVTAKGLSQREKRIAVERLRDNQTGVENKYVSDQLTLYHANTSLTRHFKMYQLREAFTDVKTYLFFFLGIVCNVPNGGISNFGVHTYI